MFDWEYRIALPPVQGIRASSPAEGVVSFFSRVAAGTWGLFSSYSGDGHSKLHFVQEKKDFCLVQTDTSEIKTRFGRIIQTHLEVRW